MDLQKGDGLLFLKKFFTLAFFYKIKIGETSLKMKYFLLITAIFIFTIVNIKGNDENKDSPVLDNINQPLLCDVIFSHELCIEAQSLVHGVPVKRKSAYMRFGRSDPEVVEKRKSAYMRFGKRSMGSEEIGDDAFIQDNGIEKRKSAYMRFGKRKSAYMRFGKRDVSEESDNKIFSPYEKRKSAYMRFGK
uniref:FMRFamide-like neuropeptides 6 (inferred by orthology to a C. elegans protein) n=1 Tax=Strongyloides venezuelensis TaxID=75913 RepID=A0A0K0F3E1_STRVS